MKIKHVNCPLCNKNKPSLLFKINRNGIEITIVKCKECNMVYLNPVISLPNLLPYHKDYLRPDEKEFKKNEIICENKFKKIEKITGVGKLLDVGCGIGSLLSAAKKRGWEVYGVEPDKAGANEARKRGFKVFSGRLKDSNFPLNYFDVATMIEVIEHIEKPVEELKQIRKFLKTDGLLIIQTINIDAIRSRMKGKNLRYYYFDHKCYFSLKTIRKALKMAGFRVYKEVPGDISWITQMKAIIKYEEKILNNLLKWNFIYLMRLLFLNKPILGSMTVYAIKSNK